MKFLTCSFKKSNLKKSVFILVFAGLASCTNTKNIVYFNNIQDQRLKTTVAATETIIQQNDLLSISVSSLNPEASALFNSPNESTPVATSATSATNTLTVGYLVNPEGDIQFPVLGAVHAAGLTKSQLTKVIKGQLTEKKLLIDPIVTIRHLNFRVSVLGEVTRPGVFTIPNEKLSLLEALGLAGDVTIYGKKDNVLLIREEEGGEKTIKRLNLQSEDIFNSPYYYLRSNDVIYVEPSENRVTKERSLILVPIFVSMVTLAVVIIDRL
jgi:polysaccharide biosynthesis/export protein